MHPVLWIHDMRDGYVMAYSSKMQAVVLTSAILLTWFTPTVATLPDESGLYVGCFQDSSIRAMPHQASPGTDDMTPAKCRDMCKALDFNYAGLQIGLECFCGYDIPGQGIVENCNTPCRGNASLTCGGDWALDVYMTGCQNGTFGTSCMWTCHCLDDTDCHKVNGSCPFDQCAAGYRGPICQETCELGTYGENCAKNCSSHCSDMSDMFGRLSFIPTMSLCQFTNGHCPLGCAPGWQGNTCETECPSGTYGEDCKLTCTGHCKDGTPCDFTNGHCPTGCDPGFQGDTCEAVCPPGLFGPNCIKTCSEHCKGNTVCNAVHGACDDEGCDPGWIGPACNQPCRPGQFGPACRFVCGNCVEGITCDPEDGFCKAGCKPGRTGAKCTTVCPAGWFGPRCAHHCGHCMNNATCDPVNGTCSGGCDSEHSGRDCYHRIVAPTSSPHQQVEAKCSFSPITALVIGVVLGAVIALAVDLLVRALVSGRCRRWKPDSSVDHPDRPSELGAVASGYHDLQEDI